MFFVGTYEQTVDAKNRLSVPFPIRSKMNVDADGRGFYVLPGQRPGTLALYPERYFEQTRRLIPPPEALSDELIAWRQFELAHCFLLDPDDQGRVLLPQKLLTLAGIPREVTLIGVQDHLEIWNRADFEAFQTANWPTYPQQRAKAMAELRNLNASAGTNGNTPA